ncbi:MAG: peptide chain release factor 1 [Phycisphaerales bacterium]|nr:peptide chain release factor 1 [cyanobacterium CYA1]GIK18863.1 MAG: peptide chain release factor 1 [Planctomycetota bacterium]
MGAMPGTDALPDALVARLNAMDAELEGIERGLADPSIAADHRAARDLSIRRAALAPAVEAYRRWRTLRSEAADLRRAIEADDAELAALAKEELPLVEAEAGELAVRVKTLLVGAEDRRVGSVMLEVRAGTGGDEAGLWARDLLAIYEKYAQRRGWAFEQLDVVADPSVGGVRSAVVNIRGEGVWSELSFEAGVHSVKRVPATESQGRIHTSTATVAVLPEPEEVVVKIDWARDVQEHVTTAQGPGGQNVNKVATAVHLVHVPTGVEVRMQESKSQHQNRERARRLLAARVHEIERRRVEAERSAERRGQIGAGERSEKIRVYRYQDNIVADQRLDEKFNLQNVLAGDLTPLFAALLEQRTAERLAAL